MWRRRRSLSRAGVDFLLGGKLLGFGQLSAGGLTLGGGLFLLLSFGFVVGLLGVLFGRSATRSTSSTLIFVFQILLAGRRGALHKLIQGVLVLVLLLLLGVSFGRRRGNDLLNVWKFM